MNILYINGDKMEKKNKKNQTKSKFKYIYIIAIIGILLDQTTKLLIEYEFNNSSCANDIVCIQAPCPSSCLSDLKNSGGIYHTFFHSFNVIPGKGIEIIKNFFYITEVKNTGAAWGMFSNNTVMLSVISIIVTILLHIFLQKETNLNKLSITSYGFLFAGIIGNLIDRLFSGYVTDFLNFYIFGYDYPVFNIADILIVVGIILMIIDVVRGEIYAYNKHKGKC